jgi:phosphatidylglycerol---prolipoprotein diacylglyceryl transferase
MNLVASIPSPSSGSIEIGPLQIHAYGLMIALGVIAAVWLFGRRLESHGVGTRDDANVISMWAVIAGVIGSRLYHVATDWSKFEHNLTDIPKIWQGGLGIPGGLIAGIGVGIWVAHRRHVPLARTADCAAPAIALAQAIGRWGNYFNQELFGRPTTLPWGLEIDADKVPPQYAPGTLFHPTFLYESIANLALCGILLLIDRRTKVRPGHLMAMYVVGYGIIRFFVEGLRIDEAHHLGGLRWNQWVALAAIVGGSLYLILSKSKYVEDKPLEGKDTDEDTTDEADEKSVDAEVDAEVGADVGDVEPDERSVAEAEVDSGDESATELPSEA